MNSIRKSILLPLRRIAIKQYRLKSNLIKSSLYKELFTDEEILRLKRIITKNAMRRTW